MNRPIIQSEIQRMLKGDYYYYPTISTVKSITTTHTRVPYTKFYRADYTQPLTIVYDRPAGYYRDPYVPPRPAPDSNELSDMCFESPCSVTFPCKIRQPGNGALNMKAKEKPAVIISP
jgi:hypothetical protein